MIIGHLVLTESTLEPVYSLYKTSLFHCLTQKERPTSSTNDEPCLSPSHPARTEYAANTSATKSSPELLDHLCKACLDRILRETQFVSCVRIGFALASPNKTSLLAASLQPLQSLPREYSIILGLLRCPQPTDGATGKQTLKTYVMDIFSKTSLDGGFSTKMVE